MSTHDLTGEGKSDAGTPRPGGEEGVKKAVGCVIRNGHAVIGYLYFGVVRGIDENADANEGYTRVTPLETVLQGGDGIFQDIGEHLAHQLLVGEKDGVLVLRNEADAAAHLLDGGEKRLEDVVQHGFQFEGVDLRHGDGGQCPVTVHKTEESARRVADNFDAFAEVAVFRHAKERVAEGDYRGEGVQDFVGDNAVHFLPLRIVLRARFLHFAFLFLKDVEAHWDSPFPKHMAFHRHVEHAPFRAYRHFQRAAFLHSLQAGCQPGDDAI